LNLLESGKGNFEKNSIKQGIWKKKYNKNKGGTKVEYRVLKSRISDKNKSNIFP
jgi:hypothetical protein